MLHRTDFRGAAMLQFLSVSYNVDSLFGDIYVNMALMTVVSIVAVLALSLALLRVGRITLLTAASTATVLVGLTSIVFIVLGGKSKLVVELHSLLCAQDHIFEVIILL